MNPKDVAAQEFADSLGVSLSWAKRLLHQMPPSAEWEAHVAQQEAVGEAAALTATHSINEIDLEDCAETPDPAAELTKMIDTRARRQLAAQMGAHKSWAQTPDRAARTSAARKAGPGEIEWHLQRLGPQFSSATPEQRWKAATSAHKAYFLRLAMASAKTRQRRKSASR